MEFRGENITVNRSDVMKRAHSFYKNNKKFGMSFSESLKSAWYNAKIDALNEVVEAKNEAIRLQWKKDAELKLQSEIEAERKALQESGLSLHEYSMSAYYDEKRKYYGD